MKLRFFINTLDGGGAEKVLVDLIQKLITLDFDCTLVTVSGGVHMLELPNKIAYRQIVKRNNDQVSAIKSKLVYKTPPVIMSNLFFSETVDIDIAYLEGYPTRIIAKSRTKRKIAFVHCDFSVNNPIGSIYKSKEECLKEYASFTKVCFVSEMALDGFNKTIGVLDNACVIHNVVDFSGILQKSREKSEYNYATNGCRMVTVGRLTPPKKYDMLLRIIARLEKKYNFELWIIGDGEQKEELKKYITDNQIRSVKMLGFQSNPYNLVKQADLFVCSSKFEGYSTAVTEAVALGVPVLTTDCAGMNEILDHGKYGWIVENNESALESKLEDLLIERQNIEEMKAMVQKRSNELMSGNQINEYLTLFEEVMK